MGTKSLIHNMNLLVRTGQDTNVLDNMEKFGGSFVVALSKAMRLADGSNFKKLRELFSDYWEMYDDPKWQR